MHDLIQIQCTVPSQEVGKAIAKNLIEEKLCACVNLLPLVTSFYIYEGEYCEEDESLLLIKTDESHYKAVEHALLELHPYELPEVIALPITQVSADYEQWTKVTLQNN